MYKACCTHGRSENIYTTLVVKLEKTRPHEKPRCKWKDNIEMDLLRVGGCGGIGLCGSGVGTVMWPLMNPVMNLLVP
jgi:hypothetical protein